MKNQIQKAQRINTVAISDIVKMAEATRNLKAQGHKIINLGIGEPDFNTPEHVKQAAIKAITDNDTHYPPIAGKPQLRAAVAHLYQDATPEHTLVSSGSKYTILNAFLATLNPGDEVVIPAPFWTSYADIVRLCDAKPVIVQTQAKHNFQINIDTLQNAMTQKTRWLLINTPNNPTGAVIPPQKLTQIGQTLEAFPQCWLLSDEIYQHLTYDIEFTSAWDALPHLRDRILITNGVSKAYAMTGWRVGFGIAPPNLIKAMTTVQAQGTSGTCSIAQAAAIAALNGPQDILKTRRQEFLKRRNIVIKNLNAIDGLKTPTPMGAFYTFSAWHDLIGSKTPKGTEIKTDHDFCHYILEHAHVAIIPGAGFWGTGSGDHQNHHRGYFRLSYATSSDTLKIALGRIAQAIHDLKKP